MDHETSDCFQMINFLKQEFLTSWKLTTAVAFAAQFVTQQGANLPELLFVTADIAN